MKVLKIVSVGLLLAGNSFASAIPNDKIQEYQQGVVSALNQNPLTCTSSDPSFRFLAGSLVAAISQNSFTSADLSDGTQPLLTFTYTDNSTTNYSFSVETSADYKSVVEVDFVQQACSVQPVNQGNLETPVIVQQLTCKTTYTTTCK